jgi:DNA uptake protein ComE-like DNA-binding protein
MQQFSVRERFGAAAAGGIVLALGLGGWSYSRAGVTPDHRPGLVPTVGAAPTTFELPAGGAAATVAAPVSSASPAGALVVHVAGAVRNPGVYKFKSGDRIDDAVHAAGGFVSGADRDALNLADTLRDADQIFIPAVEKSSTPRTMTAATDALAAPRRHRHALLVPGSLPLPVPAEAQAVAEPGVAPVILPAPRPRGRVLGKPAPVLVADATDDSSTDDTAAADDPTAITPAIPAMAGGRSSAKKGRGGSPRAGRGGKAGKFKNPGDGIVHLNSAAAPQFEQLPGVGPAMSGRIVEYRAQIGKFNDPSQLMDVKGIGEKKYAKMQPFLAL